MKAPVLVVVVVMLHALVIGTLVFIPGCGTMDVSAPRVEPPPAPVFPPSTAPDRSVEPARPLPLQPIGRPTPGLRAEEPLLGTYVVQNGDSLSVIAKRHGVSTRQLADLNGIKDPSKVRVGQKLIIPGLAGAPATESKPQPTTPRPAAAPLAPIAAAGEYTIQNGDMLSKVAKKYGVTTRQLAELNGIQDVNRVRVGQKIKVPALPAMASAPETPAVPPAPPAPAVPEVPAVPEPSGAVELSPTPAVPLPSDLIPAPAAPAIPELPPAPLTPAVTPVAGLELAPYVVREGDTLQTIANAFSTTPEMILKINQLTGASDLRAGQTIQIPCQP